MLDFLLWPWHVAADVANASVWSVASPGLLAVYAFFAAWVAILYFRST